MKENSNSSVRLASYIYDDLRPEEIVEFERELCEDPELSESYRMNVKVKDYLKAKIQLEEMKSDPMLEEAERLAGLAFESDPGEEEIPAARHNDVSGLIRPGFIYSTAIAASIAILIALKFFMPFTSTDRLFQVYYEPLDASDYSQRGETNDLALSLSEAIGEYNQGNYERSGLLLSQLGSDDEIQPDIQLFGGLNYMGLEQYVIARGILEDYIKNNTRFIPEATWYLGLCCMKTGDVDEAREHLSQLDAFDGMYKEDAQALVRKLRRMK